MLSEAQQHLCYIIHRVGGYYMNIIFHIFRFHIGGEDLTWHNCIYTFMGKLKLHQGFTILRASYFDRNKRSFKNMWVFDLSLMRATQSPLQGRDRGINF